VVRMYDHTGRYLATVGEVGQAPGQLSASPGRLFRLPDDTVVVQGGISLFHLFDRDGRWIRNERIARPAVPLGFFASGSYLARTVGPHTDRPAHENTGPQRTAVFNRVARQAGAAQSDSLVRLAEVAWPTEELIPLMAPSAAPGGGSDTSFHLPPFSRALAVAIVGDGFVLGDGDAFEIRELDASGRLRRIVRHDADLRLSESDVERYRNARVEGMHESLKEPMRRYLSGLKFPSRRPAYVDLRVDRAGRIWALDGFVAGRNPRKWWIFAPDGRSIGIAQMPYGLTITDIGADYVLGRENSPNADGYYLVRLYALTATKP